MSLLQSFEITIETGDRGNSNVPRFSINGFPLEFDAHHGDTTPGATFRAQGSPESYPHTLQLSGPREGAWDIESATVVYYPEGEPPYTVRLGSVSLEDDADLNIWYERPLPVFDV